MSNAALARDASYFVNGSSSRRHNDVAPSSFCN